MVKRLAVLLAAVCAAGLATVEPHAAALTTPTSGVVTPGGPPNVRLQLDISSACPVKTGSVVGACPRPLIRTLTDAATIRLCRSLQFVPFVSRRRGEPSVCGSGFHPNDVVDVAVHGLSGSTMWRVVSDEHGNFHSLLPWPFCGLTPGRLSAVDQHDDLSNGIRLSGAGCP